jgi:hypothetical protein
MTCEDFELFNVDRAYLEKMGFKPGDNIYLEHDGGVSNGVLAGFDDAMVHVFLAGCNGFWLYREVSDIGKRHLAIREVFEYE